jgi:chemotaxis protein histidine kinase CheA
MGQKQEVEPEVLPEKNTAKPDGFKTWHILLRTTEAIFFRGINLVGIFQDLSQLGEYEIMRVENMSTENTDTWSIFLHSKASYDDIYDVFLFIEDDCTIVNLSNENIIKNKEVLVNPDEDDDHDISILDYIEDSGKHKKIAKQHPVEKVSETNGKPGKQVNRISVDASKLDQLMFLVSELITVNSQLNITSPRCQYSAIHSLT